MSLSTEQLLLLNNLVYTHGSSFPGGNIKNYEGMSVAEYINNIDMNNLPEECGFTAGEEWKNVINAVKSDSTLMNMTIATTHVDNGPNSGKGFSAIFVDEASKEAVVTFRGTEEAAEWTDNFQGVSTTDLPDKVSTQHQSNALDWYQSAYDELGLDGYDVTVTGHSKGGNKAKYITVMDDSVDRCVSFDGQGFSDEFCDKYQDEIYDRSAKIENHNLDSDPVNILLNDIGETHYYEGYGIGNSGGFFENHAPNSFFDFNSDGTYTINETKQDPLMSELDEYLNSMIRSMPPEDRQTAAKLINELREGLFSGKGMDFYMDLLKSEEYCDVATHVLAFTVEYIEEYPELENTVNEILDRFGATDFKDTASVIIDIVQWEHFDKILAVIGLADNIPDWALEKILEWAESKGIKLTKEQARELLGIIADVPDAQKRITEIPDGSDKSDGSLRRKWNEAFDNISDAIADAASYLNSCSFEVNTNNLIQAGSSFGNCSDNLFSISDRIESCLMSHTMGALFNNRIRSHARKAEKCAQTFRKFESSLEEISGHYSNTEKKLT